MGLAVNGAGVAEANMGIARGDTDRDGLLDLLVTHFYDEHDTLWRGERLEADGPLFYRDATFEAGLAAGSRPITGWGTALADFDQDGWLDLIVTTGHIRPEPQQRYRYESPPLLWRGGVNGRFQRRQHPGRPLLPAAVDGPGPGRRRPRRRPRPRRGHRPPRPAGGRSLERDEATGQCARDRTAGPSGRIATRSARGSRVAAGDDAIRALSLDGGGSYLSSSERDGIHVGVGKAAQADAVEVRWPSGLVQR